MKDRLIKPSELKNLDAEERLNLVKTRFGISSIALSEINRSSADSVDYSDIYKAAKVIYTSLKEKGFSKNYALQHITGTMISPLVSRISDHDEAAHITANSIWYYLKQERMFRESETNSELTTTTILRSLIFEDVEKKEFKLNLFENNLKGIKYSDMDLLRGTKLPDVDLETAVLLGIATLGASVYNYRNNKDYGVSFSFSPETEGNLYQETIKPIISSKFNLLNNDAKTHPRRFDLNSVGVYSYFSDVLGFSSKIENRSLVNFDDVPESMKIYDDAFLKKAYFAGLLGKKFRLNTNTKHPRGNINLQHNKDLLSSIQDLSRDLGFDPSLVNEGIRLEFGMDDTQKLLEDDFLSSKNFKYSHVGLLLNPHYFNKLD